MNEETMFGLPELMARLPGARVVGQVPDALLRVHTDTRSLRAGDLFVALRGDRFDAHAFLDQAKMAGASAAIAERGLVDARLPGVEVPDTRRALGALASAWRDQFTLPLVAVTGSNGKTTVTQMIASILRAACGDHALATAGNFNNDIGVPLTLLRLRCHHRLAVVELGMNHPGEIACLAALARPTVALVNNAQREHQEFMSSVEAVARENGAVLSALDAKGTAVIPSDDAFSALWSALAEDRRLLRFSDSDPSAEVHLLSAQWNSGGWQLGIATPAGAVSCHLRIAGRHNVRNALAATACALAAGVSLADIGQGLDRFEPVGGRSRALPLSLKGRSVTLVDDSYNANPDSVLAAIAVLTDLPGPRLLVLGDMGEVGEQGLAFHREVLERALSEGIEAVHVCGDWMRQAVQSLSPPDMERLTWWSDVDALIRQVTGHVRSDRADAPRSVLVKGSRFMKLERVVQGLQALAAPDDAQTKDSKHVA